MEKEITHLINSENDFNLPPIETFCILLIQAEILIQVNYPKSNHDFFNTIIDINNKIDIYKMNIYNTDRYDISSINNLTIKEILKDYLNLGIPISFNSYKTAEIYRWLQLILNNFYLKCTEKTILPLKNYKTKFNQYQTDYLNKNIDTTKNKFIKSEQLICKNILKELKKPIYNEITFCYKLSENQSEFKKNLKNSIDARLIFLKECSKAENTLEPINKKPTVIKNKPTINLIDFFQYTSKYHKIMEIFVLKKLIHKHSYLWIDEQKGYKGYLVSVIKDLHFKNFFEKNKRPTIKEIQQICQNTFEMKIAIDTIKKAKNRDYDLSFIPLAETINNAPNT
ncbi:hypothetical protein [Tenacibaculum piscium]|uniref:hypothetical protein n=1 Tax=Tenacibaculum piscium TaxID=1458515 RepID=UPI001F1BD53A|nr:hypothetical protein [Tenacibaculum piscium]